MDARELLAAAKEHTYRAGNTRCVPMNGKHRMDLPSESKYNPYRTDYRMLARAAQYMQGNTLSMMVYGDAVGAGTGSSTGSLTGSSTGLAGLLQEIDDSPSGATLQLLRKYSIKPLPGTDMAIGQYEDYITGIYIPSDIHWVKLIIGGLPMGIYFGGAGSSGKSLEDILDESRVIPRQRDNLELILEMSRLGQIGFVHKQENRIDINGVSYNRIVPLQPFIPIAALQYHEVCLQVSESCDCYVESNLLPGMRMRQAMVDKQLILYAEGQVNPIICVASGMGGIGHVSGLNHWQSPLVAQLPAARGACIPGDSIPGDSIPIPIPIFSSFV